MAVSSLGSASALASASLSAASAPRSTREAQSNQAQARADFGPAARVQLSAAAQAAVGDVDNDGDSR